MRKYISYILILIVLVSFMAPVHFSLAATVCNQGEIMTPDGNSCVKDTKYNLLAPLPCEGGPETGCVNGQLKTFDPTGAGGGAFGGYLNMMIKLFIGICAVLAVIMIVFGGIEYMTSELPGLKSEGKERIIQAILGLILALGAWTLLYTINPNLLNSNLSSLTNVTVDVALNDNIPQAPVNGKYTNGYSSGENWTSKAGALTNLSTSGATVYNSQCTAVGQSNCTSTAGLDPSYLNKIHQNCPSCTLLIKGGTEFWLHGGATGSTSHQIGSPTVDLGINDNLNKYILSGTPQGKGRYLKDGISYLDERSTTNHWHAGP